MIYSRAEWWAPKGPKEQRVRTNQQQMDWSYKYLVPHTYSIPWIGLKSMAVKKRQVSSWPPGFWAFSRCHWYLLWSAWVTSKSDIENDLSRLCHQLCDMGSSCLFHCCFPWARLELEAHQTFSARLRNGFVVCAIKSLCPASPSPFLISSLIFQRHLLVNIS